MEQGHDAALTMAKAGETVTMVERRGEHPAKCRIMAWTLPKVWRSMPTRRRAWEISWS